MLARTGQPNYFFDDHFDERCQEVRGLPSTAKSMRRGWSLQSGFTLFDH